MASGDYPAASQLRPLRLSQATTIDELTAELAALEQRHPEAVEREPAARRGVRAR